MADRGDKRRGARASWFLGLVFLIVYLSGPNTYNSGDALGWARYLEEYASAPGPALYASRPRLEDPYERSRWFRERSGNLGEREKNAGWWVLWNPHHLLFLPVTATAFRLVREAVPVLGGLTFLQWWNALASAATLFLVHRLLLSVRPGNPYALPWCIFLGTSPTFFAYATDGTQYPTAVLCLAAMCNSIVAYMGTWRRKYLARAGLWLGLGVLFHQIVSLLVPFATLAIWILLANARGGTRKACYGGAWTMLLLGGGFPVAVYLIVAALALGPTGEFTPAGILKYSTLYAHRQEYWSRSLSEGVLTNLVTLVGFYFGSFRIRQLFSQWSLLSGLVLVLPAMWLGSLWSLGKWESDSRWWGVFSLLWIFPYLLFLSFWVPGHAFYHLFLTIPLSVLTAVKPGEARSDRGKKIDAVVFWSWCILAAAANLPESTSGSRWLWE